MINFTLVLVFIASTGLILGTYVFLSRRSLARQATARQRLAESDGSGEVRLWRDNSASSVPMLDEWLKNMGHARVLSRQLRAAGMDVRPGTVLLTAGVLGMLGGYLGYLTFGPLAAIALALVGAVAPYIFVRHKKRKRLEKFESQLPEAIDMLINAMRAGYSFQAAMELVGQEMTDPLGTEFTQFYEEQRLGMDVRSALTDLHARMDSLDLKMFVTAVLIQRETGGNLTEVLGNISHVIRERFRLQGELKSLTAQVRLSSKILGALPLFVLIAITLLNPEFTRPLYEETVGHYILVGGFTSQILGFLLMQKLGKVEY